jgi:hypothetical protein
VSAASEPEPQPRRSSLAELAALARALRKHGLGGLRLPGVTDFERPCHGKANGCACARCAPPARTPPRPSSIRQPWEPRAPRYRSGNVIHINTPSGAPPRPLLMQVVGEVFDQVMDAAAQAAQPPQLEPAIKLARAAQERDDAEDLVRQLRDVAHAAIASIVRVRAAEQEPTG